MIRLIIRTAAVLCLPLTAMAGPTTRPRHLPGQIIVDPANPAWLVRYSADGKHKPFFMCGPGDPEGFLHRGKLNADGTRDGDQMQLIDKLKLTGANCIYLQAVRSHGGDGDKTHNPFIDHDPARGLSAKVLDQWETWFDSMDKAGIVVFLFIYDDSALVWKTGDVVGPEEKQFLDGLVNRFKHHRNLIWCVAEEYRERLSPKRASGIAAAIRAADEFAHPIAIHQNHGLKFDFPDDPSIDQFAIQYNVKTIDQLHAGAVKAFADAKGRYNVNVTEVAGHGRMSDLRQANWAIAMGGAYVMVFEMDIASTKSSDLEDCGRLVQFFESTAINRMAPHDELAAGGTQYVLADPGRSYVAYSAKHGGKMGLKGLPAGSYDLTWFDCAAGNRVERRGVSVAAGEQVWEVPAGLGAEVAVRTRMAVK
ncbi:MAG: hypothetical protein AMK72_00640 [Planctomycetes bacterium SM23_25]|nr:MAG: hypothetical protein AMK72_00640 [Planctomycetes bacterium SM23_25]